MIRHNRQNTETISFFSFLSVISCTIGLLMVVLVCVTVMSFWGAKQVIDIPSQGGEADIGTIYVECRPDGLRVHPLDVVVTVDELEDPSRWIEGPFGHCLEELRRRGRGGSVYFLVRRGGLAVFRKALGYTRAVGGGTTDAVEQGKAVFSIGQQLVLMPGEIGVNKANTEPVEPARKEQP